MILNFVVGSNLKLFGGIQKHVNNIVSEMKVNKIHVELHVPNSRMKILNKPLPSLKDFFKLRESKGVIHFFGFTCLFVGILLRFTSKNKHIVYTPCMHPFYTHRFPILARFNFYLLLKPSLYKIDKILVLSQFEADFFSKYVHLDRISFIPSGIDEIISKNDISNKRTHFLFVGRDDDNKRMYIVEELAKLNPNLNFICVCNTNKSNSENIKYVTGLSDYDLKRLYQNAISTLIPSKYESFSIVALESIASGTPVIISENVQIKSMLPNKIMRLVSDSHLLEGFQSAINEFNGIMEDKVTLNEVSLTSLEIASVATWKKISDDHINIYKIIYDK
ncbi:glycosyltransferase family 4 protein [Moritella sp. 24]|uniref:glycosyltransferase family 4 protein n=1 Tax=Moritella sp. 24 TaxID=2746230 RepID=UPI001BADAF20|nr:glycosyltransferase family 4 protein [Moritella sp. 24]QUM77879.1 glycosyltransferase family 4 protein [Moritella sp. 24]